MGSSSKYKSSRSDSHRHKNRRKSKDRKEEEDDDDDMNLSKNLYPIGHYINDPQEMINQIFNVINKTKIKAMLTSSLKDMDLQELKDQCLLQLQGMSKKRIKHVLAGIEMEESSNTEDTDDDDDDQSISLSPHRIIRKRPSPVSRVNSDLISSDEGEGFSQERKIIVDETKSIKKIDVNLNNSNKTEPFELEASTTKPPPASQMELLELKMRARAIKALLNKSGNGPEILESRETNEKEMTTDSPLLESENLKELSTESKEDVIKRRKAREALELSETKKKIEEEEMEKKHEEIRKKAEEQRIKLEREEEERIKKAKEEEEKKAAKKKKEEERKKFLLWKEEKIKKEEARREEDALREMEEAAQKTRQSLINLRHDRTNKDNVRLPNEKIKHKKPSSNVYRKQREMSYSSSDSDSDSKVERARSRRAERVEAIKKNKRTKKPASDIEDGEVDSDGEVFEPIPSKTDEVDQIHKEEAALERVSSMPISMEIDETEANKVSFVNKEEQTKKPYTNSKKKPKRSKTEAVFIADDSDNEKLFTSSDNCSDYEVVKTNKSPKKSKKKKSHKNKVKEDEKPNSDKDLEEQTQIEEENARIEEEQKRLIKMERLQKERLKRMEAFQKRTEIQSENDFDDNEGLITVDEEKSVEIKPEVTTNDIDDPMEDNNIDKATLSEKKIEPIDNTIMTQTFKEEEEETSKNMDVSEIEIQNGNLTDQSKCTDFYKSFYEEEEKKKLEPDVQSLEKEEKKLPEDVPPSTSEYIHPKEHRQRNIDGVGAIAKMCESQGIFEAEPKKPSKIPNKTSFDKNLPCKKQVEEEQELEESLTWADRWYQNKKVKKVVEDSKKISKVKQNIKLKIESKQKNPPTLTNDPKKIAETEKMLPSANLIGSMEEYAKLVGKSVSDIDQARVDPKSPVLSDESSSSSEDDELWGDILKAEKD